ncbi:septum formation inhibitor Maf [Nocardia cyriacigeorgica]|uniref:nucleoside triphosphate pyrophosphatase n=1 Tax=Nocardia cyriacigeorgica TaxID=135487 RepID=UPI001894058E|nr:Maf family nucleotide pyrophosphatase [Nocardia cyriacigeorgica]MBF6101360.1 septum formation inhibitor Maf [Nocardia cyriacigeorgica]MBF6162260.1 septum formation inhibitor Maf [Nocardia cyriacigeorgica]MBF6201219.1 septum formation inhibitor Maf [Nocardia cyriacigeorgica]MBF6319693.1 septum formation inhibitor Maf [Nocardia cyriacigeorgica]MBF6347015.1 septum formation inhibitor Maf [Nocardia cyriacigeorgica]
MTELVLASASPARRTVLRSAGIEPVVRVSDVDEDAVAAALPANTPPQRVVVELAKAKAATVAAAVPEFAADCVVVGCDSMLLIDGVLQGKPHTPEVARARWNAMAGRSAELITGHCVLRLLDGAVTAEAVDCSSTTIHFGKPEPEALEAYIATGEPLQVAGAFTLDGLGGWFVDRIDGDPSSVIGIGLPLLRRLLDDVGVAVVDLWRHPADN